MDKLLESIGIRSKHELDDVANDLHHEAALLERVIKGRTFGGDVHLSPEEASLLVTSLRGSAAKIREHLKQNAINCTELPR